VDDYYCEGRAEDVWGSWNSDEGIWRMSKGKKVKLCRPLTVNEKKEVLREHFYYEATMLDFSVERLVEYRKHNKEKIFENMAVDACLLHARNLLEFLFYPSNMKNGYIRAYDVETSWPTNQEKSLWIKKVQERVSDEVTHLTLGRISSRFSGMDWDCCAIRKEFFDVMVEFLSQLSEKYMDKKLGSLRKRISDVLGSYDPQDDSGVTNTSGKIVISRSWTSP